MSNKLKIVYFGTPEFAVEGLKILLENNYEIVAVVTAPDKPAGRGQKIQESDIKKFAKSKNLKILQPASLKSEEFISELKSLNANLQIIVAFRMLPKIVWDMPKFGTFNLHASLLPQYRGAAPINWAIINGEEYTGVTSFFINENIDTGNIILQEKIKIEENDDAGSLHDKLMILGGKVILKTVQQIETGTVKEIPQDKIAVENLKLAPKIFRKDTKIDWNKDAKTIYNFIRGLSPYPASWTILNNKNFKIYKASYKIEEHNYQTGKVFSDSKSEFKITCKNGYILPEIVQLEGKKRMPISDFLKGQGNKEFIIE